MTTFVSGQPADSITRGLLVSVGREPELSLEAEIGRGVKGSSLRHLPKKLSRLGVRQLQLGEVESEVKNHLDRFAAVLILVVAVNVHLQLPAV